MTIATHHQLYRLCIVSRCYSYEVDKYHQFSFDYLDTTIQKLISHGFSFTNCLGYYNYKLTDVTPNNLVVLRVDVDISLGKVKDFLDIFKRHNIKSTFFIRLHAKEYNPFSFENYLILKDILAQGHEIGLHSEVIDQSVIWGEQASSWLKKDISTLEQLLGIKVNGVASHGGLTGLNNLHFWDSYSPLDFDLKYEAYDKEKEFGLFWNSLYISDSDWTQWKFYMDGNQIEIIEPNFLDFALKNKKIIYMLIHPETFYHNHPHE